MWNANTIMPSKTDATTKPAPGIHFRLYGCRLEKSIWRHNFTADSPITTKFAKQMQNDMPMTTHTSKLKPQVQFQYDGRPFSETGSSFILTMDWDISSKFGVHIDFHLLKQMPSLNLHIQVHFWLCCRHLQKSIWRHNSAWLLQNLAGRWKKRCRRRWPHIRQNGNRKLNANMAAVRFCETGSYLVLAMD